MIPKRDLTPKNYLRIKSSFKNLILINIFAKIKFILNLFILNLTKYSSNNIVYVNEP